MNPVRRRRAIMVGLILLAAAIAAIIVGWAIQRNVTYLYTPSQVRSGEVNTDARFRLGGVVCEGSVQKSSENLTVNFYVTDRDRKVPVRYEGILPDMFREGTSVIATGRIEQNNLFVADEVLAKHDETYMPREVAAAMEKAKAKHTQDCGAD
jgi:cytochrome c-type biogenesis protein CcmE